MYHFGNYSVYTHTKPHSLNHKMDKSYFPGGKGLHSWQKNVCRMTKLQNAFRSVLRACLLLYIRNFAMQHAPE